MSARILPLNAPQSLAKLHAHKTPWSPSDRDRLIFQWVKFDGHTQDWVAQHLEISQPTVSRIVERYERWVARGGPGASGGLSHEEQIRYQRWITYERNERILASCLRIATDLERQIDVSHSTITKSNLSPSQESEIKTYHEVLDRTASAAKFLRLALRTNLEQLKLVEREPLPALDPLTAEEAEDNNNLASPTNLASGRPGTAAERRSPPGTAAPDLPPTCEEPRSEAPASERPNPRVLPRPIDEATEGHPVVSGSPDPDTPTDRQVSANAETTHKAPITKTRPTPTPTTTFHRNRRHQKTKTPAYQDQQIPPERTAAGPTIEPTPCFAGAP